MKAAQCIKAAEWRPHPAKVGGMFGGGVARRERDEERRGVAERARERGIGSRQSNISRCKIHPREKQPGHCYTIYRLIGGSTL